MSGQPQPTRLLEAFATSAIGDDITLPIPQPSQIGITLGAASLTDGFPPQCFQDPAEGGVLPSGADFNGVLNMATAPSAYLMAGQHPFFDVTLATFMGGYALGATIAGSTTGELWTAIDDGLTNDPDIDPTGWQSNFLLHSVSSLTAGTYTNVPLPGGSDYVIDVDTTGGDITINGFEADQEGQTISWCNIGTGVLRIGALVGATDNQVRMNGTLSIAQNDSGTFRWCGPIGKWVMV